MTMNIQNDNRRKRTSVLHVMAALFMAATAFIFASCDDDINIQQSYPFTVETMPVPNKVLKAEGRYSGTLYTIRYFQFEGQGSLKMDNGITFLPNDRYLLENEKFRLYYTSEGEDRHDFIVVIEDNLGNSHELTFDFNNSDGGSGDTERIEDTEGGGK